MHHRNFELMTGDTEWVSNHHLVLPGIPNLSTRWLGYFITSMCITKVACRLDLPTNFTHIHPIFRIILIYPYVAGGDSDTVEGPIPIIVRDDLE